MQQEKELDKDRLKRLRRDGWPMKEVGKKHSLGVLVLRRAVMLLCVSCRNFLLLTR